MVTRNAILKNGGAPTKSITSKLLLIVGYQTWYQIKAKTKALYPMVKYTNYLICVFMNIYENLK